MSSAENPGALTAFQVEVTQVFFSLPESAGFLLAGGAALAAQHLTTRPTQDLDLFTAPTAGDVTRASRCIRGGRPTPWVVDTADPRRRDLLPPRRVRAGEPAR
ncbi:MAG: hypothetical protein ACRDSE_20645 [Pseudonocardiaceae bacterium]